MLRYENQYPDAKLILLAARLKIRILDFKKNISVYKVLKISLICIL